MHPGVCPLDDHPKHKFVSLTERSNRDQFWGVSHAFDVHTPTVWPRTGYSTGLLRLVRPCPSGFFFSAHQCPTFVHLLSLIPIAMQDGGGIWGRCILRPLVSEINTSHAWQLASIDHAGVGTFSYVSQLVIYLKDLTWSLDWQKLKLSKCVGLVINSYSS